LAEEAPRALHVVLFKFLPMNRLGDGGGSTAVVADVSSTERWEGHHRNGTGRHPRCRPAEAFHRAAKSRSMPSLVQRQGGSSCAGGGGSCKLPRLPQGKQASGSGSRSLHVTAGRSGLGTGSRQCGLEEDMALRRFRAVGEGGMGQDLTNKPSALPPSNFEILREEWLQTRHLLEMSRQKQEQMVKERLWFQQLNQACSPSSSSFSTRPRKSGLKRRSESTGRLNAPAAATVRTPSAAPLAPLSSQLSSSAPGCLHSDEHGSSGGDGSGDPHQVVGDLSDWMDNLILGVDPLENKGVGIPGRRRDSLQRRCSPQAGAEPGGSLSEGWLSTEVSMESIQATELARRTEEEWLQELYRLHEEEEAQRRKEEEEAERNSQLEEQSNATNTASPPASPTSNRLSPSSNRTVSPKAASPKAASVGGLLPPPAQIAAAHIDRQRALRVFFRLEEDCEIASSRLTHALTLLGHRHVEEKWKDQIVEVEFVGCSFLDKEEFMKFLELYEEMFVLDMQWKFEAADANANGTICAAELAPMLRDRGVTPLSYTARDLIKEVVDEDVQDDRIDFEQFIQIWDRLVRDRAGFTVAEVDGYMAAFHRCNQESAEEFGAAQLAACLTWLGFPSSQYNMEELLDKGDHNGDGVLSQSEYLRVLRNLRERQLLELADLLQDEQWRSKGVTTCEGLPQLLDILGHKWVEPAAVREAAEECGHLDKEEWCAEDVYEIVKMLREHNSFRREELQEIHNTFQRFESDGGLGGLELMGALQWLGYPQRIERMYEIVGDFDFDGNVTLDKEEFEKAVRQCRGEFIESAWRTFETWDKDHDQVLKAKEVRVLLLSLGYAATQGQAEEATKECPPNLTFWDFVDLMEVHRKKDRDVARSREGFSPVALAKLKAQFDEYDPDGTGCIARANLYKLMSTLFPDMISNFEAHRRAKAILQMADANSDGELDFPDFLRLMRRVQNDADALLLKREREGIEASGFSHEEVKEFRKVFSMCDLDESGDICFEELRLMLQGLCPKVPEATDVLRQALEAVDTDGNKELDFSEYLVLMRKIIDENWNNIRKEEQEAEERRLAEEAERKRIADEEAARKLREEEEASKKKEWEALKKTRRENPPSVPSDWEAQFDEERGDWSYLHKMRNHVAWDLEQGKREVAEMEAEERRKAEQKQAEEEAERRRKAAEEEAKRRAEEAERKRQAEEEDRRRSMALESAKWPPGFEVELFDMPDKKLNGKQAEVLSFDFDSATCQLKMKKGGNMLEIKTENLRKAKKKKFLGLF